jgi:hypothetical protein
VEALGPQILDIGERGGLPYRYIGHIYLGWPPIGEITRNSPRPSCASAVELEPPGAFAGQSRSLLARHLAYHGRADEVMELFESAQSQLPASTGSTASARGAACSASLRRFYLCDLYEQAASLAPLVEGLRELSGRWISYDGRLVETRAGLVAAATRRWEEAERQFGHR